MHNGGVVLAKRTNQPVEGDWFVPGDRIQKDESILDTVHRVAATKLGIAVQVRERFGAFDHFYAEFDVPDVGKHYVAHRLVVEHLLNSLQVDDQHEAARVVRMVLEGLHEYVTTYLNAASEIPFARSSEWHRSDDCLWTTLSGSTFGWPLDSHTLVAPVWNRSSFVFFAKTVR